MTAQLDKRQRCPSCGRDYRGHDEPDVQPGQPCPADDCPARSGITPGPWAIEQNDESCLDIEAVNGGPRICTLSIEGALDCHPPYAAAEVEANARLIAAAPDLLALVREVESRADYNAQEADPDSYVHSGLIRIRDDCRALLALIPLTAPHSMGRPSLTFLHLKADGTGVATSGHVLGMYRATAEAQSQDVPIPATGITFTGEWKAIVAAIRKATPKRGEALPAVLDLQALTLTIYGVKVPAITFSIVHNSEAGAYPDSASNGQVIPRPDSLGPIPAIKLDPVKLALFGKEPLTLTFCAPERAILVRTSDPDFLGVLMPFKLLPFDNGHAEQDWVRDVHGTIRRAAEDAAA